MRIQVNGEAREVPDQLSLQELFAYLGLPEDRLAVELNQSVVRRVAWPSTELHEGDRLEIVHFVGGGCIES